MQKLRRLLKRNSVDEPFVAQITELVGDSAVVRRDRSQELIAQMPDKAFGDECEPALGLQLVAGPLERPVQLMNTVAQRRIVQHRAVDRRADEACVDLSGIQVEDPLAKTFGRHRAAVVRNMRGKQRHHGTGRTVLVPVQVVAHDALIDDQQRPGVMRVHGIGVIGEAGVEDLFDSFDLRTPGGDLRACSHDRSVPRPAVQTSYKTAG